MMDASASELSALSSLTKIRDSLDEALKLAISEAEEERDFLVSIYHNMSLSPTTSAAVNNTVTAMEQILRALDVPVEEE
jgi:hypothetical protein